jgi:hypothetical protein
MNQEETKQMKLSHRPVAQGFHVCLLSPLGSYPESSVILDDAAYIMSPDICFSIVRITKEDWGFSEVDMLSPLEIPLLGAILLAGPGYPYPMYGLTLEAEGSPLFTADCIAECREHLIEMLRNYATDLRPTGLIHRPPALGGISYDSADYEDCTEAIQECTTHLEAAGPVLLRGVASLIKAHMAWKHSEFSDAACIHLWIALDAAFSLTLQKLRDAGNQNPTSADASAYFDDVTGDENVWEKFFEDDYENRIRVIHPDSRFSAEARPQLLADDFLELNDLLIPYFRFLATGVYRAPVDQRS